MSLLEDNGYDELHTDDVQNSPQSWKHMFEMGFCAGEIKGFEVFISFGHASMTHHGSQAG